MNEAGGKAPLLGLECLKLLASLGIVMFHQSGGLPPLLPQIGYAGLPVFTMITAALAARSARATDWATFRRRRLRRLLLPWLWWSCCYAIARFGLAMVGGQSPWEWPHVSMLVIGTYPHLWYLPYAAVLTLVVGRWLAHFGSLWTWTALGVLMLPICNRLMDFELPMPLPQWLFVTPAALLGLALSHLPNDASARRPLLLLVVAVLMVCGLDRWLLSSQLSLPYSIGITAVALVWSLPRRASARTSFVTSTSFGIYVLHMGVFLLLALLSLRTGFLLTPLQALAATFVISMGTTLLLQRTPLRTMV
jgi:fucose 4-O-acetylase-like acetyltransferase